RLWPRTNDYVFALAELQVLAAGKNLAPQGTVSALDSIEAGRWSKRALVDGNDSRQLLPDPTAAGFQQRQDLLVRIQQAEREPRAVAKSVTTPAVRADLARQDAALADLGKKVQALQSSTQVYAVVPRPPRPIHVLKRSEVERKGPAVNPGALSLVPGLPAE